MERRTSDPAKPRADDACPGPEQENDGEDGHEQRRDERDQVLRVVEVLLRGNHVEAFPRGGCVRELAQRNVREEPGT